MQQRKFKPGLFEIESVEDSAVEEFVEQHTHCQLCETQLEISHQVYECQGVAIETARCPSCQIKARRKEYLLQ